MTARETQKQALEAADKELDLRITANRAACSGVHTQQREVVSNIQRQIANVKYDAERKEKSYSASGVHGCLIVGGILAGMFGCFVSAVASGGQDRQFAGYVTMVAVCIGLSGLLWKPIMRFFTAEMPARSIRSQLPQLRRELDYVRGQSEAWLNQEIGRLEAELQRLKYEKEQCQEALAKI